MISKKFSEHLWMPFTSHKDFVENPPVIIEKGKGVYLYDENGDKYIDGIGSWWVSIFGHNHPEITSAVRNQLDKIEHVLMAGCVSTATLELVEVLGGLLPPGLKKIFFSDDGSTSVEVAMKIALQYHQINGSKSRTKFVSLDGGYHGDTLGAASVGSIPRYHGIFHSTFKKQYYADSPYCYRCPAGKEKNTCNAECMDSLEAILKSHGEEIAACIFEPMVQGAVGMRMYPPKVLKKIFQLCNRYEILTIADEVAMGLGRTGKMFACDHAGVVPDMMCLAKGLTAGYMPLAVTAVKEKIHAAFCGDHLSNKTFEHGHTFTGNPLAAATACATLNLLVKSQIPDSITTVMEYFRNRMEVLFKDLECVGDVRCLGMAGALDIVKNKTTKEPYTPQERFSYRVCNKAREKGLLIRPLANCIYFMPAFIITKEEIDIMLSATLDSIIEVMNEQV
ncbi:Adenosylmethionine-8-amino-7-oxononanoate aminotransferase [Chitinispirillum alkaliphilum]|nr:Adenosylmethionine-8-amino-7-oxononanoate aminotransferase [Chitinispirillum alkaliphilum]